MGAFPNDVWFYLASRFCAATALTLLRATVGWHLFAETRSPFYLGLLGLAQFIPAFSLLPVGGMVADRFERRRVVMIAQTVPLLGGFAAAWGSYEGHLAPLGLFALAAAVAAAAAFDNPARASLLPSLVPADLFPRAVTVATTAQALAFATGPMLSGFTIAKSGLPAAYTAVSFLLLVAISTLALVRPSTPKGKSLGLTFRAVREGVEFVFSRPVIWGCMMLDMLAVILGGASALLPVYANDILLVGPRGYGVLSASLEIGALLTSLVLIARPPIRNAGRSLLLAVSVFGSATVVFGLSRFFPLSVVAYMIAGMADQVSVVMRSTIIQLNTPDALRGRVSSVNFMFINASNQLGAAESGFVAALTSPTFSVVSGGVLCLVVTWLVARHVPALREYRI